MVIGLPPGGQCCKKKTGKTIATILQLMVYKPRNKVGATYVTEGGGCVCVCVCVLEHPSASLKTPLDWHHILLPPPYCCLSCYDSCPSPLPMPLPPPLPPCITSLLTVPECVTQCTVEQTRKVFDQGTIFSVKMCGGLKYNVGICSCEYQSGTCNGLKFISLPRML